MISVEYRKIIRIIVKNILNNKSPGLKKSVREEIATEIARNIHARMYGANVDGVDSPIWKCDHSSVQPNVDASILLATEEIK